VGDARDFDREIADAREHLATLIAEQRAAETDARDQRIIEAYKTMTLRGVAYKVGLTSEGVRQILARHGVLRRRAGYRGHMPEVTHAE
jgi:DNA-directed RNA polymerase sigma subunit (sigma70/sigma32)